MSAFLSDVAARAFPRADAIQPRLPTLFERVTPEDSPVLVATPVVSAPAPIVVRVPATRETTRIEAIDSVMMLASEKTSAFERIETRETERRAGFSPPGRAKARPTSVHESSATAVDRVVRETQIETQSTIEPSTTTDESHAPAVIPSVSEGPGREVQQARESRPAHPGPSLTLGMTVANAERLKWGQTPFTAIAPPRIPGVARAQVTSVAPQPTVNVSIGRIEVRASTQQPPRKTATTPREPSLEDYLRRRDGRQGR